MEPLIDPSIMQLIQFFVYAVGGLALALTTYYTAKTKTLSEGNKVKLESTVEKTEQAVNKIQENTNVTREAKQAVQNKLEGMHLETQELARLAAESAVRVADEAKASIAEFAKKIIEKK